MERGCPRQRKRGAGSKRALFEGEHSTSTEFESTGSGGGTGTAESGSDTDLHAAGPSTRRQVVHLEERVRGRGKGRKRRSKRRKTASTGEASQGNLSERDSPPRRSRVSSRGRSSSRGRRRGGRSKVRGRGLRLDEEQVRQLLRYQNTRKQKIKELVDSASPGLLRQLLMKMAELQPGLVLDLLKQQGEVELPVPEAAPEPQEGPLLQPPELQVMDEQPPQSPAQDQEEIPPPEEGGDQLASSPAGTPEQPVQGPGPGLEQQPPPQPQQQQQPDWCVCSHCREMPDPIENLCCNNQPDYCISEAAEMNALVLDPGVLMLQRLYRGDIFNVEVHADRQGDQRNVGEENKRYRHAAYRQFILWQHGQLGRGNRRVIPSCCVRDIRRRYPDPLGYYVGFRFARLV